MLVNAACPLSDTSAQACLSGHLALLLQAVSDTEGEITKRQVQISTAGKQAEKLSKECSKTQKELDKATGDLQAKQKEQEVSLLWHCVRFPPVFFDLQASDVNSVMIVASVRQQLPLSHWSKHAYYSGCQEVVVSSPSLYAILPIDG